jgi:ribosome recycling factor
MNELLEKLQEQFDQAIAYLKEEFSSVRGARPTPMMVEDIKVVYFDQPMSVKQLGSISVVPPREIQVQVWDAGAVKPVASAIEEKLGIQVAPDGNTLHCNLPDLTQERKEELAKLIKQKAEEARIRSRVARDDIKKELEKLEEKGEATEDDKESTMDQIQKKVDAFNGTVEELVSNKLSEIGFS